MLSFKVGAINNTSNIKAWILFVFMGFPVLYPVISRIIGTSLAHLLLIIFTYCPFLYLFLIKREPIKKEYVLFVLGLLFVFIFYSIKNIQKDFIFKSYALPSCITFFSGIIGFFIVAIQDNSNKVKKCLKLITIISVLHYFIYTFDIANAESYAFGYDMFLGFRMLLPCLLALNFALSEKNAIKLMERVLWIVLTIVSAFVILAYGSRGPLLGIIMFLIMKYGIMFLAKKSISLVKKIGFSLIAILAIIIVYVYFIDLLVLFSNYLESLGISSRTVRRFITGTATFDNGRIQLFSNIFDKVNLFGHGPFSDQYYFGEGNYAHNFILEVLFDFGFLGGFMVISILCFNFVKLLRLVEESPWFEIFVVFFSYCFGRLLLSGTFWNETNFWMLLGFGYVCLRDSKVEKEISNE